MEWIDINKKLPAVDCEVLLFSNYGIRTGTFSKSWGNTFQDHGTGNTEGMENMAGEKFKPTHWATLPVAPTLNNVGKVI